MLRYSTAERNICKMPGVEYKEIVFNYTSVDYFSLVHPDTVSSRNSPIIYCQSAERAFSVEVRTVEAEYRGARYYFTIVQPLDSLPNGNSYGRQIALNLSAYFKESFFREQDLRQDPRSSLIDLTGEIGSYHHSRAVDKDELYALCFKSSNGSSSYYYKAFAGSYSILDQGEDCPFGPSTLDSSQFDIEIIKTLEQSIRELASQKLPALEKDIDVEWPELPDGEIDWEKRRKMLAEKYEYDGLLKERCRVRRRIDRLTRKTAIRDSEEKLLELEERIVSHPYHALACRDEEIARINQERTVFNNKIEEGISSLRKQIDEERSKRFSRPVTVSHEECRMCPMYEGLDTNGRLFCRVSPQKG